MKKIQLGIYTMIIYVVLLKIKRNNNYIKQDENKLIDFKGNLYFEEIDKKIEYFLPCKKNKKSLFVIKVE